MIDEDHSLVISQPRVFSLDEQVAIWLHEKANKSGSERTRLQYKSHIEKFRAILQKQGLDLDSPDEATISALAQGYAAHSTDGRVLAGATYNQRLASLSSFYRFAIKKRWLAKNPMEITDRRKATYNHAALPFALETVLTALDSIDRSDTLGKRDYALLSILLSTGRRVSEVCNMKCGDIAIVGATMTITFPHCKGNEVMYDQIDASVAEVLIAYLREVYGDEWRSDAPVWLSCSRFNKGQPIGTQAIAGVCKKYFHDSRVHATRHTHAVFLEATGASLSDIANRLGHKNLSTTSTYMKQLHRAENPYASKLATMLKIGERK